MSNIDLKLAEKVLLEKILKAAQVQRELREEKKDLLFRANELLSRGDVRRPGVLEAVNVTHQRRVVEVRKDIRAMTLALAYVRGRPYKSQEKSCAYLGKPPHIICYRIGIAIGDAVSGSSVLPSQSDLCKDILSWMKGNPTLAVRAARDKAESAIVGGTAFDGGLRPRAILAPWTRSHG